MKYNTNKIDKTINCCSPLMKLCPIPGPTGPTGPAGSSQIDPYNLYVQSTAEPGGDGS